MDWSFAKTSDSTEYTSETDRTKQFFFIKMINFLFGSRGLTKTKACRTQWHWHGTKLQRISASDCAHVQKSLFGVQFWFRGLIEWKNDLSKHNTQFLDIPRYLVFFHWNHLKRLDDIPCFPTHQNRGIGKKLFGWKWLLQTTSSHANYYIK